MKEGGWRPTMAGGAAGACSTVHGDRPLGRDGEADW